MPFLIECWIAFEAPWPWADGVMSKYSDDDGNLAGRPTDCRELLYPWHPWHGRRVFIHRSVNKAFPPTFHCSLEAASTRRCVGSVQAKSQKLIARR